MQPRILISLSLAAILAMILAIAVYRAGGGLFGAILAYSLFGTLGTVIVATLQIVLASVPKRLNSRGPSASRPAFVNSVEGTVD